MSSFGNGDHPYGNKQKNGRHNNGYRQFIRNYNNGDRNNHQMVENFMTHDGYMGAGIIAFSRRKEIHKNDNHCDEEENINADNDNTRNIIDEIYMIRNNGHHTLFLPFGEKGKNEGDDLISTATTMFNKYTHYVFEKQVGIPSLYHKIKETIFNHRNCTGPRKCWGIKDKKNRLVYFLVELDVSHIDPIRMLAKMERKNPNYVLVRFPIDLIAQQLEEWFSEERGPGESISQIEMVNRKKGEGDEFQEKIENTIPQKYYQVLRNAIPLIKNMLNGACNLKKEKWEMNDDN